MVQSSFTPTPAGQEAQVCVMGRGTWAKKKKKAPKNKNKKLFTLAKNAPDICAHCPLPPAKLAVKSTVVPNIYLHTKNS